MGENIRHREKTEQETDLPAGLYEQVISESLAERLSEIPAERRAESGIDEGEAPQILSKYVSKLVERKLSEIADTGGSLPEQIRLVNHLVSSLNPDSSEVRASDPEERLRREAFSGEKVDGDGRELLALAAPKDPLLAAGRRASDIPRPETSLSGSSLFTGAEHEPQLYSELKKEIASCDEVDMLVSFIKWSGLRLIFNALEDFTNRGGTLRIITTSYLGATDYKAVKELSRLPNAGIRISYDTERTRLHAKAFLFKRKTGFSTAYIGSSNLSNPAMTNGLEWNVKITESDQSETMRKVQATFEGYWNSRAFEAFHAQREEDARKLKQALRIEEWQASGTQSEIYVFTIRPYPFQQAILDELAAERELRGRYRNLLVAATGTGKTVISAFDYRNFCSARPGHKNRLLFVAHREEILTQALATFRGILKDPNFGSLDVGHFSPDSVDHLFISVQTMNSQELYKKLAADFYDFIIVDEFHHAAARTYQAFLSAFQPQILLGLTATPERADGRDILQYFDGHIAAEIRLPEAIDRRLLCPFQYFGVSDSVDLDSLSWKRGGYEKSELDNLYVFSRRLAVSRAEEIIAALLRYVTDIREVKGIGFCVSVEHAKFMAQQFNDHGIPSIALSGSSKEEERSTAKSRLADGEIRFIFVVDLYNEGVDIPEINTILFLRPTESLTVFLQQLGRGLRLSPGKDCLTVLDFIGRANKKYNFEQKFAALLQPTKRSVQQEVRTGFTSLPKGCYIELEKKARECILENIRQACHTKEGILSRIRTFEEDSGQKLSLETFAGYYGLNLREFYARGLSFSRMCALAGVRPSFEEPLEEEITKALPTLAAMDSREFIRFILKTVNDLRKAREEGTLEEWFMCAAQADEREKLFLEMFYITLFREYAPSWDDPAVRMRFRKLSDSPVMCEEIGQLLTIRLGRIDFVDKPAGLGFECPLSLHCTYTRDQLLTGLGYTKAMNVREGVKWLPERGVDVLLVTLNKSDKDYSPTTMYRDYSVSEDLFHWQSQSTTSEGSKTGQRYIHHREMGTKILLFVREYKSDVGGAVPYTFLGPVDYVSHSGSCPMNILWRLETAIPAKFLGRTNQTAAG